MHASIYREGVKCTVQPGSQYGRMLALTEDKGIESVPVLFLFHG